MIAKLITYPLSSAKVFGAREFLTQSAQNLGLDKLSLLRMAAAHLGLYGNSGKEAVYPTYQTDADQEPLNANENNYTLWLPAPDGPFYLILRLYGPEEKVLAGQWLHPPLVKA